MLTPPRRGPPPIRPSRMAVGLIAAPPPFLVQASHLKCFVSVAELRSFTRVAQTQSIAQSPLSKQIRDLEAKIGAPLLVRQHTGVSVTPAGETIVKEAPEILAHANV
jgi:DNA-binding transcriptional LysR family regulator